MTSVAGLSVWERMAAKLEGTQFAAKDAATPGALAQLLDSRTVQTRALDLIDKRLLILARNRSARLILSMPPQEGKSQRASLYFPLWCLIHRPDWRIAIASYEMGLARRWGRAIRNMINSHPELGLAVRNDTSAAHEWALNGKHHSGNDPEHPACQCEGCPRDDRPYDGGVICVGLEGGITGRPVDMLIIDDPVKGRAEADSEAYRKKTWQWWTDSARMRLAPGAPVLLIMTRWHEDDLAGRLLTQDEQAWDFLNIPAQANHRPEKGEVDPLGRQPGEWMGSARGPDRAETDWKPIQRDTPSTFAALYQGRPAPDEGTLLKRAHWQFYDVPRYEVRTGNVNWVLGKPDEVIQSWDMAFKNTKASDYVVCQIWARWGLDAYLLWQLHQRLSFTETCAQLVRISTAWPQTRLKLVEDKANGTAVIDQLQSTVSGLVPVQVSDGKYVRAVAVSPYVESRHVWLPNEKLAPWVGGFVDECALFPNSTHDDQVDGFTQALDRLLGHPKTVVIRRPPQQIGLPSGVSAAMGGQTLGNRPLR